MDDKLSNATTDLNNLANCATSQAFHVPSPVDTYYRTLMDALTVHHRGEKDAELSPDVNTMIQEIYAAVVTETANKSDAIAILKQAIEDRQCPADDCKECQYYVPGGVDKCDTARALAEYLIYYNIVKVNKPDSIDKSEK